MTHRASPEEGCWAARGCGTRSATQPAASSHVAALSSDLRIGGPPHQPHATYRQVSPSAAAVLLLPQGVRGRYVIASLPASRVRVTTRQDVRGAHPASMCAHGESDHRRENGRRSHRITDAAMRCRSRRSAESSRETRSCKMRSSPGSASITPPIGLR